ncbi:MAG: uroporphyrinogen decarboxylase [Actinomycetota bacterium]
MRVLDALALRPVDRPPVWFMRQAGRYLPEYRDLRSRHSFQEAVHTPEIAAEITLQPIRRFGLDAAIVFSDIMTPLEAMGVTVEFTPGPELSRHGLADVMALADIDLGAVDFVFETLRRVRAELPRDVALIGFSGAPFTLLAYLMEGGGSKDFMRVRGALASDPVLAADVLMKLAESMHSYLAAQIEAGADVVQVFDSWAGLVSRDTYADVVAPAARRVVDGLEAPAIYFAPGSAHLLDLFPAVGAAGYGVDWRQPIGAAWDRIGRDRAIQGNLDPAVLLTDPSSVESAVGAVLRDAGGSPGHIFNLGHGIHRSTPVDNVAAMVQAVKETVL